jgi:hypothetical protein
MDTGLETGLWMLGLLVALLAANWLRDRNGGK